MTKIELKQMYFQMFTLPNLTFYLIVGKYIIHYGNLFCNGTSGIQHQAKKSHDFNFCEAELTV